MDIQIVVVGDGVELSSLRSRIQSGSVHLIDLQDTLFSGRDVESLVELHAQWFQQGAHVHYVATRPVTRGSCVVAAHSVGDGGCHVAANLAGAKQAILSGHGRVDAELKYFVGDQIVPRFGPPGVGHHLLAKPMDWIGNLQQGYTVPFVANILSTFGVKGLTTLFPLLEAAEKAIGHHYGEKEGHLVTAFLTLGNGCAFCMYGHLYAANLLLFEENNTLGPICERETERLGQMTDTEVGHFLEEHVTDSPWASLLPTLRRIRELRAGKPPTGDEDTMLTHSLQAWALINECSLQTPVNTAPPLNQRIARNRRLQKSYREARRADAAK
jgi:hypothetical protein